MAAKPPATMVAKMLDAGGGVLSEFSDVCVFMATILMSVPHYGVKDFTHFFCGRGALPETVDDLDINAEPEALPAVSTGRPNAANSRQR